MLLRMVGNLSNPLMAWLKKLSMEYDTLAHEALTSARHPSATATAAAEQGLTVLPLADCSCHENCVSLPGCCLPIGHCVLSKKQKTRIIFILEGSSP